MSDPHIGAILLCRLDSTRLPGKALIPVAGRPLIWYPVMRCRRVPELQDTHAIVVATSDRPVDDPIADYAGTLGLPVYRGSADDVSRRVLEAAETHDFDYFIRVNGDSPFVEPGLLSEGIARVRQYLPDLVTNLYPRSYPYGVSVEIVRTATYRDAYTDMHTPAHFEHVTAYLYEHIDRFSHVNLIYPGGDYHELRLTVDTHSDLDHFSRFIAEVGDSFVGMSLEDVIARY